jgi:D-arginine dehydrogenase
MMSESDIVVIGGGMAGASIAAHLSEHASVRLLEMEYQPGVHSTGRSAALFLEPYGNATVRALTRASRRFLCSPPPNFCAGQLMKPRAVLITVTAGQTEARESFLNAAVPSDGIEQISATEARALCPVLKEDGLIGAMLIRGAADIEVHELHQGYLRLLKTRKGVVTMQSKVTGLEYMGGSWSVTTAEHTVRAKIVVNAAGAWAGEIGKLAGALDVGLKPLKRTACLIEPPPGQDANLWPVVGDVGDQFYFRPYAGMLMLSPADEIASQPEDAQPDEWDIAVVVDRIEQATTLVVKRIAHKWAGLRSFVSDRSPVVGYDPNRPNFFWLAGLGGFGIQTAPALSRLAASQLMGSNIDDDLRIQGMVAVELSPSRFA